MVTTQILLVNVHTGAKILLYPALAHYINTLVFDIQLCERGRDVWDIFFYKTINYNAAYFEKFPIKWIFWKNLSSSLDFLCNNCIITSWINSNLIIVYFILMFYFCISYMMPNMKRVFGLVCYWLITAHTYFGRSIKHTTWVTAWFYIA